jgi:AraC-like DNA-binding protein
MNPSPLGGTGNTAELRRLHVRPGLGASAHVVQARGLGVARVVIDAPALIIVSRGCKSVHCSGGLKLQAKPGQAIALAGNQTVDFFNEVTDGSRYEAHWLVFDPAVVASFAETQTDTHTEAQRQALRLPSVPVCLHESFERACHALAPDTELADQIIAHRLQEVLLWLALQGCAFAAATAPTSTAARVRSLVAGRLDRDWVVPDAARELAMSEPTLRRRLAAEGQRFGDILMDARMSLALTLLQASDLSVNNIANAVGYSSASRFAVRFRQRFGFAPSAIRGHERNG